MTFRIDEVKAGEIRKGVLDRVIRLEKDPVTSMEIPADFSFGGWVYVLSNEAMPGIYKIGMTTSTPEVRAREVSQGTGVPMPYVVEKAYFSESPREDEAEIHDYLSEQRLNPNREFFRCSLEEVIEACEAHGLHERKSSVELIADRCSVICFDRKKRLNVDELFEDIGLTTFGCKFSIAEGLIRIASRLVKSQDMEGNSIVISEGKATLLVQEITQNYQAYLAEHPEHEPGQQVCNSPL